MGNPGAEGRGRVAEEEICLFSLVDPPGLRSVKTQEAPISNSAQLMESLCGVPLIERIVSGVFSTVTPSHGSGSSL